MYLLFFILTAATSLFAAGKGDEGSNPTKQNIFVDETKRYTEGSSQRPLPRVRELGGGTGVRLRFNQQLQAARAQEPVQLLAPARHFTQGQQVIQLPLLPQQPVQQTQPSTQQPFPLRRIPNFNQPEGVCGALSSGDLRPGGNMAPGNFWFALVAPAIPNHVVYPPIPGHQQQTIQQPPVVIGNQVNIYNQNTHNYNIVHQPYWPQNPPRIAPRGVGLQGAVINGPMPLLPPSFLTTPVAPSGEETTGTFARFSQNNKPQDQLQMPIRNFHNSAKSDKRRPAPKNQPPTKKAAVGVIAPATPLAQAAELTYGEFVRILSLLVHTQDPSLANIGFGSEKNDTRHEYEMLQLWVVMAFCQSQSTLTDVSVSLLTCSSEFRKYDQKHFILEYAYSSNAKRRIPEEYLSVLMNLCGNPKINGQIINPSSKMTAMLRSLIADLLHNRNPNFGIHNIASLGQKYTKPNSANAKDLYALLQTVRFYVKENSQAAELLLRARQAQGNCKPKEVITIEEEDDDDSDSNRGPDYTMPQGSVSGSQGSLVATNSGTDHSGSTGGESYRHYCATQTLSHIVVTLLTLIMQPKALGHGDIAEHFEIPVL